MPHFDIGFVRKQSSERVREILVESDTLDNAIKMVMDEHGPDTLITLAHRRPISGVV